MIKTRDIGKSILQYLTSSHVLILATYTMGFVVLTLVTALTVSYISTREAERVFVEEGKGFTQLVAQSSVIPLLTGSEENSSDYLNPLLSYQNVYHITVYDRNSKSFFTAGNSPAWMPTKDNFIDVNDATLIHEDKEYWYLSSPVMTEKKDSERIGNVFTVITKKTINTLGGNILTYTMWICGIAALLLWIKIYLVLRRITLPIRSIAGYMDISRGITKRYRIPKRVPSDVKTIYNSFNNMLEQIEARDRALKDNLSNMEEIVNEKTLDLKEKNKQLEDAHNKAIVASHAKDIFVANVSHELRTPIQAIMGNCELLGDKYQEKELSNIIISANQLLHLVNNILDLSKIENDKLEVFLETVVARDILPEIAEADLPVISANNNTFEIKIDDDVHEITTDCKLVTQIINNLLSNAGRYTQDGHITFRVRKKLKNNIEYVCFEISDTGIGIDQDKLEKIFQPFEQADMSKTRLYGGTGLGLTISRKLATLLGGEITVESTLGKGSTFTLWLPEGESIIKGQRQAKIPEKCLPHTILLAEDHPFISDAVKQLLESDGHQVTVATDGVQAMEILQKGFFDIALIDVHMPEFDGIEVIKKYKAAYPHSNTKIFLLTADVTDALGQQAGQLGVKIIQKPFSRAQLAASIAEG